MLYSALLLLIRLDSISISFKLSSVFNNPSLIALNTTGLDNSQSMHSLAYSPTVVWSMVIESMLGVISVGFVGSIVVVRVFSTVAVGVGSRLVARVGSMVVGSIVVGAMELISHSYKFCQPLSQSKSLSQSKGT